MGGESPGRGRGRGRAGGAVAPSIADILVLSGDVNIEIVQVDAQGTTARAACPGCGAWSTRVHSAYLRFPADVPSAGRRVVLQLRVRRFRCRNTMCPRRAFAEQIPGLTRRRPEHRAAAFDPGRSRSSPGRPAGARLAALLGVFVSRSSVLRLVDALPEPEVPGPWVVGVDECTTCNGRHPMHPPPSGSTAIQPPAGDGAS